MGVVESIEEAKTAGQGGWQMQAAILHGYELLGRCMGMFSERIELAGDERLIARLHTGRKRAAGLLIQAKPEEDDTEKKPN